jgi:hypothetical protein
VLQPDGDAATMSTHEEIAKAKAQLDWIARGNGKKYEDPATMREKIARLQAIVDSEGQPCQ